MVDFFLRSEYFDLTHVSIFAGMLVLQNDNLDIDGGDIIFLSIVEQFSLQRHSVPSCRFLQLQVLNFLEILHIITGSYR